jgi:hypothetical protein
MIPCPQIANAPGLKWTKVTLGWTARWRPRSDLVEKGFKVGSVKLWTSYQGQPEPDDLPRCISASGANRCKPTCLHGRTAAPQ